LQRVSKDQVMSEPAYDLLRGIPFRKWPNIIEKSKYYFKSFIYSFFSKNRATLKIYYKILGLFKKD